MPATIKEVIGARPWWMNCILLFCSFMTFVYLPWDIFIKPLAIDQEVWFGIMFTGWPAKIGALLHWFVYGAGTWGFLKMKRWLHPWAALYVFQIALGMLIWSLLAETDVNLAVTLIVTSLFVALGIALLRAKPKFQNAQQ